LIERARRIIDASSEPEVAALLAPLSNGTEEPSVDIRHLRDPDGSLVVELRWDYGILQKSDALLGGWDDVIGALSPYRIKPQAHPWRFFRLRTDAEPEQPDFEE
jgi:hypothetical protein